MPSPTCRWAARRSRQPDRRGGGPSGTVPLMVDGAIPGRTWLSHRQTSRVHVAVQHTGGEVCSSCCFHTTNNVVSGGFSTRCSGGRLGEDGWCSSRCVCVVAAIVIVRKRSRAPLLEVHQADTHAARDRHAATSGGLRKAELSGEPPRREVAESPSTHSGLNRPKSNAELVLGDVPPVGAVTKDAPVRNRANGEVRRMLRTR